MLLGKRQVMQNMLRPFKAVMDLGGARGVMMAYSELDAIPSHVNPTLYKVLDEWGFDGFVTADDTGLAMLQTRHRVADSPASAIQQWFNAGLSPSPFYGLPPLTLFLRWHDSILRLLPGDFSECNNQSSCQRIRLSFNPSVPRSQNLES